MIIVIYDKSFVSSHTCAYIHIRRFGVSNNNINILLPLVQLRPSLSEHVVDDRFIYSIRYNAVERWWSRNGRERKKKPRDEEVGRKEGNKKWRRWKRVFFSTVRASKQHSNFFSLVCSPVMMTVSFARSLSCVLIFFFLISCLDRRRCCCCLASFIRFDCVPCHAFSFARARVYAFISWARAPTLIFWSLEEQYFGRFNWIKINYNAHGSETTTTRF